MNDLNNYFADEIKSLDELIEKNKKGAIKRGVGWMRRKYGDFMIFNGELLIADGVASVAGAGTGEILSNNFENDLLVTGGTVAADTITYLGAFGFVSYLEKKNAYSKDKKAFAQHMGKFGLAFMLSGVLSFTIRLGMTYYLNKEGYSGGEAALLAKIPSVGVYLTLMNIVGYKLGLVGGKKK
jgi:hypothetical protein